jgi:hypothetical protein
MSVNKIGAFTTGTRVRVAATTLPGTNWFEGPITAIQAGPQFVIEAQVTSGSGTRSSWTFSVVGSVGSQGNQGPQGNQGTQGFQGSEAPTRDTEIRLYMEVI